MIVLDLGHDRLAADHRAADGQSARGDRFGEGMDDNVGPMGDRPHQGRSGAGRVDDKRNFPGMGQFGQSSDIAKRLLRVARRLHVEETGVLVDFRFPFLNVVRMEDPADLDSPLPAFSDVKVLEGPAVELDRADEIDLFRSAFLFDQKSVGGKGDGGHSGGHDDAGRIAAGLIPFEKSQSILEKVGRRVGDPGVTPGRNEIGQSRLEVVRIPVGLGSGEKNGFDDRPLIARQGLLHRIEAVDGDGVEFVLFHSLDERPPLSEELFRLFDIAPDSRPVALIGTHAASL